MADYSNYYIKTHIGQHDFKKKGCDAYCKISGKFCPIANTSASDPSAVRWTDLSDSKLSTEFPNLATATTSYVFNKSNKKSNKPLPTDINNVLNSTNSDMDTKRMKVDIANCGYSCWGDGSGFQYDIMSRDVIGPGQALQQVYDLTNYQINHEALKLGQWNSWIEKFQYDYRFGRVSDKNAECILFPNVDNPWMFTEYVFKGIGKTNSKYCKFEIPDEYIVQPTIYNPNNLELLNGDMVIKYPKTDYDGKYKNEQIYSPNSNSTVESNRKVKQNRTITGWQDLAITEEDILKKLPARPNANNESALKEWEEKFQSLMKKYGFEDNIQQPLNYGVKLYRAKIPVQSIKWGQHGNIPPHTLDMTAPNDWMDPTTSVSKIQLEVESHVGSPLYASAYGILMWANAKCWNPQTKGIITKKAQAYINTDVTFTKVVSSTDKYTYYTYTVPTSASGTKVAMPQKYIRGTQQIVKPNQYVMGDGEYCHGGCEFLKGANGRVTCSAMENAREKNMVNDIEKYSEYFDIDDCKYFGQYGDQENPCPSYIPSRQFPTIATYQLPVLNGNSNQIALEVGAGAAIGIGLAIAGGVTGAMIGTGIAFTMFADALDKYANQYSNLNRHGQATVTTTTKYKIVNGELQKVQLNKQKYNQYGQGVQYLPDTGKYAIDSYENANEFDKGDTNAYGDINTRSFPVFFTSVMHCASRNKCNSFIGKSQQEDFEFGKKADDKCSYYMGGDNKKITCPYNGIPKRALEFCRTAKEMSNYLNNVGIQYSLITKTGILSIEKNLAQQLGFSIKNSNNKFSDDNGILTGWLYFDKLAVYKRNDVMAVVAIKVSSDNTTSNIDCCSDAYGAAAISKNDKKSINFSFDTSLVDGYLIIGEFRTKTIKIDYVTFTLKGNNKKYAMLKNEFQIVYEDMKDRIESHNYNSFNAFEILECFYWYQPLTNDGKKLTNKYLDKLYSPDTIYSDDSLSPIYNDDSSTDIPVNLRQHVDGNGYWFCKTDPYFVMPRSDCTIIDNDSKFIGGWHPEYKDYSKRGEQFIQDIEQDISREGQMMGDNVNNGDYTPIPNPVNKKGYWIDESGEYIIDELSTGIDQPVATQEEREQPSGHGICISFKKSNTQVDGQTGKKTSPKTVNAAVYSNDPYLVLYHYRYDDKGKALPLDSRKPQFEQKDSDKKYLAPCRVQNYELLPTMRHAIYCPKCDYYLSIKYVGIKKCPWCGSSYQRINGSQGSGVDEGGKWPKNSSVIKKFFKLYALGNVDVWTLPGTAIKTDAYFWRHQAQITNAIKRQINAKLGTKGTKCYSFKAITVATDFTLGYPDSVGEFKKVPPKMVIGKDKKNNDITNYDDAKLRYSKTYIDWGNTNLKYNDVKASYNPIMPRHMIPGLYNKLDTGREDQGVIAPYTSKSNDALKIVTLDQLRVLRNKIQPMTAYVLDSYYPSSDYPTLRASYNQRQSLNQPIIYQGRRATVPSQVLATTIDGSDSYQQYYSGDPGYGQVKEYFPSGYTWWYMKQVIGGRFTNHSGGHYHMDDKTSAGYGIMEGGAHGFYTMSDKTIAYCSISLYGLLPLDKEIVRAYVIIGPSSENPSKNPIGKSWNGGSLMSCHYHAFTQRHKSKQNPLYEDNPDYYDGKIQHLHGGAGYGNGIFFDENGDKQIDKKAASIVFMDNDIKYQDNSQYTFWGYDSNKIQDDRYCYYDMSKIYQMTENIALLYDVEFYRNVGTPKKEIKDMKDEKIIGKGYDENSFPEKKGFYIQNLGNTIEKNKQKFQYIILDDDNNLVLKYPDSVIWKNKTEKQIQDKINIYTTDVQFGVSDGTEENSVSYVFTQTSSELYGQEVPEQSQSIPGYFDLSWTNTKGYVSDYYKVDKKKYTEWNAPVIFQDLTPKEPTPGVYSQTTDGDTSQNGTTLRAIDVTGPIKSMYDHRVARRFYCQAGRSVDYVKGFEFYQTKKTALDNLDFDVNNQNEQKKSTSGYTLLSEQYAYPELENINVIPTVDINGGKYQLFGNKQINIKFVPNYPFTLQENINCEIVINGEIKNEQLSKDTEFNSYTDFEDQVKSIFGTTNMTYKKVSDKEIFIQSKDKIEILTNFGGIFSANNDSLHRIIDVSSYMIGYSPVNFIYDNWTNGWRFNTYDNSSQSFAMDLLRAPLCKEQRGYRERAGYIDYSNAKCPNTSCDANKSGCAIAANLSNKYFSGKSDTCPLCGTSLKNATGVSKVPGDGIKTYFYDAPFDPDPFICQINIGLENDVLYKTKSCRIYIKRNKWSSWQCIASIYIETVNGEQKYMIYNFKTKIKSEFNGQISFNHNTNRIRARYIKVEVDSNEKLVIHNYEIEKVQKNQMIIKGNFYNIGPFKFQQIEAGVGISATPGTTEWKNLFKNGAEGQNKLIIINAELLDNEHIKLYLNREYPDTKKGDSLSSSKITFGAYKYTGGITSFSVYGIQYKTKKSQNVQSNLNSGNMFLTITDGMNDYKTFIDLKQSGYKLPFTPSYIDSVCVSALNGYTILLTEYTGIVSKGTDPVSKLTWNTQEVKIQGISFLRATGGNYYYDPWEKSIYIPRFNGTDENKVNINNFEQKLKNTSISTSYLPAILSIVYYDGNGKQITLHATACGNGPSYMLQKNSIVNIISKGTSNFEQDDKGSCKLVTSNGKSTEKLNKINWSCFNDKPSNLSVESQSNSYSGQGVVEHNAGEFKPPAFNGKEICNKSGTTAEKIFSDLYGLYGQNIIGKCETDVTFVGPPDKCMMGTIIVEAPAYFTYTYNIAEGNTITYEERTGGIEKGILICHCNPVANEGGRATLCYQIPTLLVYAKERNPYS